MLTCRVVNMKGSCPPENLVVYILMKIRAFGGREKLNGFPQQAVRAVFSSLGELRVET